MRILSQELAQDVGRVSHPPFELREWHDQQGRLMAIARMKSRAMNTVRLETADGTPLEVDARDLCEVDLDWLARVPCTPELVYEREQPAAKAE